MSLSTEVLRNWRPPDHWPRITTLDAHAGGEPLRIIVDGFPDLPGTSLLARRRHLRESHDLLRKAIMWEPRGHREMYGCLLTPPVTPGADFGVLFMHNEGYSTMCGHGIIALSTVAIDTGMVPAREPETVLHIDTPAGLVTSRVQVEKHRATSVRFENVPSFVASLDETVEVPGLGRIRYDLAFGGAFYAYVRSDQLGLRCVSEELSELVAKGMAIKRAVMNTRTIIHPLEKDLGFLYGTIFLSPPIGKGADSRNVCVFADGEVDRSPTGTGVSGRMAIEYARQHIQTGQSYTIESIVGSTFTGKVLATTTCGSYAAVIPEVEGRAFLTGRNEFFLDPADPFRSGFLL